MEELKPCPFCRGTGHFRYKRAVYYGINGYGQKKIRLRAYVQCGRCKARGSVFGATVVTDSIGNIQDEDLKYINEQLTKVWNRRAEE